VAQIIHINDAAGTNDKIMRVLGRSEGIFSRPEVGRVTSAENRNPSARRRSDVKGARRRLIESRDLDPGCKERISHP